MLEIPKYKIKPKPERFLINHVVLLIFLGLLLYFGIYINYWLLQSEIPGVLNGIYVMSVILILIIDGILCYVKYGNYEYVFYPDMLKIITNHEKKINYSEIKSIKYETKLFDKYFNTGTIILMLNENKKMKLKHLKNSNQIYFYVQKAIQTTTYT